MAKKVTKGDLDRSARELLGFLERNVEEEVFKYPFSHSFPRICCESVSLILTYLLEEKYRLDNVRIIKGTTRGHEHHLWVMVGDLIYDLTAHQFPRRKPIIGALCHRLPLSYPDWEVEEGRDFVNRDEVVRLFRNGVIPF
ncbi:MAG: Uncharacterized protein FD119_89 [Stygiobacter sp.]|nr:MAG: Uncharacterized protein FD119_89 [Stygiobacter sp.]